MKTMQKLSYGMYIVGASDTKNVGCVVNTVCQISNNPTLITVSINHENYTNEIIKKTKKFSVSILSEELNPEIIGTFGYKSSKDIDKFATVTYELLDNLPILSNSLGAFTCEVLETLETNTHTIFLAKVINEKIFNSKKPMTYQYYREVLKGKSPQKAPTYEEEKAKSNTTWRCTLCGYEVELDNLPSDFRCPICGAPIEAFEKITK